MTIFTPTNTKRVEKIKEILGLLHKSCVSNRVDREATWSLLEPVINQIGEMIGEDAQKPETTPQAPEYQKKEQTPRLDIQIKEAAETAPLKDLTSAMAIYLNRIDAELHKEGR